MYETNGTHLSLFASHVRQTIRAGPIRVSLSQSGPTVSPMDPSPLSPVFS
jgi:hypothetical protein